jgi:DNA helicase II / ATP-dependent DNA helicase PcrA
MSLDREGRRQRAEAHLSEMQRDVMLQGGRRLVTACPGAGKTRSVGARAAVLDAEDWNVALVTYTNVAADEMRGTIMREYGARLGDRHYVGTLHGFLLRSVFRPFAHLVMGCSTPPVVRMEATGAVVQYGDHRLAVDDFELNLDGSVTFTGRYPTGLFVKRAALGELMGQEAFDAKVEEARSGVAQVDEAMYWCMRTLREYPDVCSAVASRFGEIIVDEAQDTSALQIECLRLIAAAGLRSLFLVGDFDQSIYEFKGASRELCLELASEIGLDEFRLSENYRSSQVICNVSARFRALATPDAAVGPAADVQIEPSVTTYDLEEVALMADEFAGYLQQQGIMPSRGAVIVRNNKLLNSIGGRPDRPGINASTHLLLDVARTRDSAPTLRRLRDIEEAISQVAFGETEVLRSREPSESLRDAAMYVIGNLPPLAGLLGDWIGSASETVAEAAMSIGGSEEVRDRAVSRFRVSGSNSDVPLSDVVQVAQSDGLLLNTVHGVKGMSIGGVLVVADHQERYDGTLQADEWAAAIRRQADLSNDHVTDEELRIVYVALTRAECVCRLAVPIGTSAETLAVFSEVGFTIDG